jgi:DNA ligase D-like protein (predicted 3'-phosphoesterase)
MFLDSHASPTTAGPRTAGQPKEESRLSGMPRFVIQQHLARTPHFDFRLERDGVFKSLAVPKGLFGKPGVKLLAVQVNDHDLAFGDFEGEIPQGQYGAARAFIWDHGSYQAEEWPDRRIILNLQGALVSGGFTLIRFGRGKHNEWLIIKRR